MGTKSFIEGLMRDNYEAVGFIPSSAIEHQYITNGRFVIQDKLGKPVGYILHGKPTAGGILTIAQHCIEYDFRERGYGRTALDVVIERARNANCRAIKARVAEDLESNLFWQAYGFELTRQYQVDNQRKRAINVYILDLWPRLF